MIPCDPDVYRALPLEIRQELEKNPLEPNKAEKAMDRDDIEMLFRCGMQFFRYLAKKYGFTIKQWPEK